MLRALELMRCKLAEYGADNYAPLSCAIVAEALKLRASYSQPTFFDSIHVAIAKVSGFALATSDSVLRRVAESHRRRVLRASRPSSALAMKL